jgi:hypothetical protein
VTRCRKALARNRRAQVDEGLQGLLARNGGIPRRGHPPHVASAHLRDRMAKPEENEPQIAARRLAQILEEHGIAPQKHAFALILVGLLIGCFIGLFIGWLIWT